MIKFPGNLEGPQISEGDLLHFKFSDCELTLKVPVIPNYDRRLDNVTSQKDFTDVDRTDWMDAGEDGQKLFKLVHQEWIYEDLTIQEDIALCYLTYSLFKISKEEENKKICFNSDLFFDHLLGEYKKEFPEREDEVKPGWPCVDNDFFFKPIEMPPVNGISMLLDLGPEGRKFPHIGGSFPLGREYILNLTLNIMPIYYTDGRENPYSPETLHNLGLQVFDELVSYIDIQYTPEALAEIEALRRDS